MENLGEKVVYQIYPRSFCDSNGDGIGDIPGITSKLDYLKELGVDYLWLTPFFVSPQRDNGYDIADYRNVEPMFGTMADVDKLLAESEKRGIGLMFDMVFNHTSTKHEWFQRALAGEEEYQNYYIFKEGSPDTPPTNWESKFGGNAWEYVPALGKWYLHLFDVTQADLNWENPKVRQELKDILRFWKEKGVKGFRFDVVNLISKADYENDNEGDGRSHYTDGPRVHEYLKELVADAGIEDMITVGEMSSTSLENCVRYSGKEEKELQMCFHFQHLKVDYKGGDKWSLMPADFKELNRLFAYWQMGMQGKNAWDALFWDNHDQPRALSRFGDDTAYWEKSGKLLAGVLHLMRGTPYIYQGDEIGMTNTHFHDIDRYRDVESKNYFEILKERGLSEEEAITVIDERSRDNGRTPMQWDSSEHAGFTTGTPWIDVVDNYKEINVERQRGDADSMFAFYQKLIRLRKANTIIAEGSIHFPDEADERVLQYERRLGDERLFVYGNLKADEVSVKVSPEILKNGGGISQEKVLVGNYEDLPEVGEDGTVCLRAYEMIAVLK